MTKEACLTWRLLSFRLALQTFSDVRECMTGREKSTGQGVEQLPSPPPNHMDFKVCIYSLQRSKISHRLQYVEGLFMRNIGTFLRFWLEHHHDSPSAGHLGNYKFYTKKWVNKMADLYNAAKCQKTAKKIYRLIVVQYCNGFDCLEDRRKKVFAL